MPKKLATVVLACLFGVTCPTSSWAGVVLDKIEQTGVITAGARTDAMPFGYKNEKGEWIGYSLDILELIRKDVEKQLGKPIKLQLVEITPQNRFAKIKDGSIDIECSSTTFTWEREKEVDFSVSYFASGTQMLVKKDSRLSSIESLAGKRIGAVPNTTNEAVIRTQQPKAELVAVKDRREGLQKLEKGEIDGFVGDGIVLEALRKTATNPNNYAVVPEYPYMYESYACLLPQDDSAWRDGVNYSLVKFMGGIVSDRQESVAIYEKWFGENSTTPYSREMINDYFQGIVNTYEWIPDL